MNFDALDILVYDLQSNSYRQSGDGLSGADDDDSLVLTANQIQQPKWLQYCMPNRVSRTEEKYCSVSLRCGYGSQELHDFLIYRAQKSTAFVLQTRGRNA